MASSYLPPDPVYDRVDLLEYMSDTCDQILADDPIIDLVTGFDAILTSRQTREK